MAKDTLETLLAKEEIRELVLLYSRAVDRKDIALLRDLYTADATDTHGNSFDGPADAYCDFLELSLPHMPYSGHHVCNHLIHVDGNEGDGEVYAIAWHVIPDRDGSGLKHDVRLVRYLDRYRREEDGRWRFAKRVVTYDAQLVLPADQAPASYADGDPSYAELLSRLFARGARG